MQFNSYLFILAVVPAFVLCYFLLSGLNKTAGKLAIIAFGAWFYAYGGWDSAAILGISLLVNLLASLALSGQKRFRKLTLALAVLANVGLLLYFKYCNFALGTLFALLGKSYTAKNILLPLGISFFTFQQIMYLVSLYRGEIRKLNLLDYLCYILYFPKLIMGPLAEPTDFIGQLNQAERKRIDWENVACGVKLFGFGLFKKMILADTFARAVNWGFGNLDSATSGDLFLVTLFYTFEIYFDFSGYSDMAVGVSQMVNITLPMNFDSPYKAFSIRDFWKRWHMTLTAFLTKNVYFPLGGSRKGTIRTYINILAVFLVSGLWHGANWTFLLWGLLHGLLQVLERIFHKRYERLHGAVKWLYAFIAVNLLWLLFRADSIGQWKEMLTTMFSFRDMAVSGGLIRSFVLPETAFLLDKLDFLGLNGRIRGLPMLITTLGALLLCLIPENNYRNLKKLSIPNLLLCAAGFVWAFLSLSSESVFVYFNF